MRLNLVQFVSPYTDQPIYINPSEVAAITRGVDMQVAVWLKGIQYPVLVVGTTEDVAAKLQEAVCE